MTAPREQLAQPYVALMRRWRSLPLLEYSRGISPAQAAKSLAEPTRLDP